VDGRRRQATATFKTKKDAHSWLAERSGRIARGEHDDGAHLPLSSYLTEHWLPFYAGQRSSSSYQNRESVVRNHIIPALGHIRLGKLSPILVQTFYNDLSAKYAPNTVLGIASTLSAALRMAVEWELLHRNPAQGARTVAARKKDPAIWTPEQVRAFLAAETDPHWYCLWAVLLETGMRRGELLALRWGDIDFEGGTVRVERTITKAGKGKGSTIGPTKTARGVRNVALSASCLELLRRRHMEANKLVPIFPFSVNQLYDRFVRLAASVPSLPRIRPHDTRHSNVVAALEAGIPLIVISERLGHASIRITGDVYAHVTRRLDKASAETLGTLLLGEHVVDDVQGFTDIIETVQDSL
jgi:integrase